MGELRMHDCGICGAIEGSCGDITSQAQPVFLPVQVAVEPEGLGMRKKIDGRFFKTTSRVFVNNRLVVGMDQLIPWQQAIDLGLVEDDRVPIPVITEPTPEQLAEVEVQRELPEGEDAKPLAAAPEIVASVARRKRTNPNGKLKAS